MDIVNRAELRNFIRSSCGKIYLLPKYISQFAYLVLRRVFGKIQRRLAADIHFLNKQRPVWLGSRRLDLGSAESKPLRFPRYIVDDSKDRVCVNRQLPFDHGQNDPEWYLSRSRWGECLYASLDGTQSARIAVHEALDWLGKSLPKSDAAWEPYSSCERVVNLAVLLSVFPHCLADIDEHRLRRFFEDSLLWIDGHLEYYGTRYTNNHILNNARAMVVAGAVLQCAPAIELGVAIFAKMARDLFQPDGFLRERSSHYQVVVCNWLLDTVCFARAAQAGSNAGMGALEELEALSERVTRATSVLFTYLGEATTHIGDISPDVHPGLSSKRLRHLYPASFSARPDTTAGRKDDWVFVSKNGHVLVTCAGLHSYPVKFTTHGHRDLGGFVWLHKGNPILVDAGRSRYTRDLSSQLQSGPIGHNTILINGLGALAESLFVNAYWFPEPYSTATVTVEVDPHSGFTLAHNGFRRIKGIGEHVREVGIEDNGVVVHDRVEGSGAVILETLWHFPPHFSPAEKDKAAVTGAGMCVTAISATGTGQEPDHQWQTYPFASAYGDEQPAPMLRLVWSVSLPCSIRTVFSLAPCAA